MSWIEADKRRAAFDLLEESLELPMLILSLAVVPLIMLPILINMSTRTENLIESALWIIWAAFAAELVAKTYLAEQRLRYLKTNWFDVMIVVLPFLRPLRIIRSARALTALRGMRIFAFVFRATYSARQIMDSHGLKYVLLSGMALTMACAILVGQFERTSQGNIKDFHDALWWSLTTITTVGYGDTFPVTPEGRGIAVFLMIAGITLFSFITANIAAFLVRPVGDQGAPTTTDLMREIAGLRQQIELLSQQLETARPPTPDEAETIRNN